MADEIELAQTKRAWMIAVASWYTHSNQEPTKLDLSGGCMTTAQGFQRPRPQDFDPDRKVRRARVPVPEHVKNDPRSTRNMVKALNAAGFKARASVLSEITDDTAGLLVDFPGGKRKGRFSLDGKRNPQGRMTWTFHWDGNGTNADLTRKRRCLNGETYQTFRQIVATGYVLRT